MGIAGSSYYDAPQGERDDAALVEVIARICDEFEAYGLRRVRAALQQQGLVVNHKKIRRLMREHGLQPRIRRRFVATTDSDHDGPIFADLAKDVVPAGPDQLWVGDLIYVATTSGFAYVAVILEAWSRRVVGYAIGCSIDARLALAALRAALDTRHPPQGCIHHSDRGSQGGFNWSSQHQPEGMLRWRGDGDRIERFGTSCRRPGDRGWRGVRIGSTFGR